MGQGGGVVIPANSINPTGVPRGIARPDVYAVFVSIETHGLQACDDCEANWLCREGIWRCEHRQVERRLGWPVDLRKPSDLAIAFALKIEGEHHADIGRDRAAELFEAGNAGLLSPEDRNALLKVEYANRESELVSAAYEVTTGCNLWSSIPPEAGLRPDRERRWRGDLTDEEQIEKRKLEEARFNAGLTAADRLRYEALTEPQPIEEVRWDLIPREVQGGAEKLVEHRAKEARGELPRTRRISRTDRSRMRTYVNLPFTEQLGAIATETDPSKLEQAIRELRRQAKQLGFLPRDHDRRRWR